MEQKIKHKGEEVKQSFACLVDRQVADLLDRLQSMKLAAEKEFKLKTDAVQLALTELEGFRTSSLELKSKVWAGPVPAQCVSARCVSARTGRGRFSAMHFRAVRFSALRFSAEFYEGSAYS